MKMLKARLFEREEEQRKKEAEDIRGEKTEMAFWPSIMDLSQTGQVLFFLD